MQAIFRIAVWIGIFSALTLNGFAASSIWTWHNVPHLAVGNGLTSYLTISDPQGIANRTIWVYLYGNDGSKLTANVEDLGSKDVFSFTLGSFQERTFILTGGTSTLAGWVQIAAEGTGQLNASLRFAIMDGAGNISDAVGILPAEPNRSWTLTVEKRKAGDDTGVAIVNPWSSAITGFYELYQNGTRVPGTSAVPWSLNASGHESKFVSEIFGNVFSGTATMRISATSSTFSAVALRVDNGLQYSSLSTDPGVQYWSWNYTDTSGSPQTGTWIVRLQDGWSFMGYEQNSFNTDKVRIRGVLATDVNYFLAEWIYSNDFTTKGTILFQGTPSREGSTDVVNGRRTQLDSGGLPVGASVSFKATRIY